MHLPGIGRLKPLFEIINLIIAIDCTNWSRR
jgi:hypothetical protein